MDHPLHEASGTDIGDPLTTALESQQEYRHGYDYTNITSYLHSNGSAPNTPTTAPLPVPPAGLAPEQYESLTGLLLQAGSSPAFGVEGEDDESYKYMSMDNGSQCMDDTGENSGRRRKGRCKLFGCYFRYDSPCAILLGLLGIGTVGVILGLIFPSTTSGGDDQSEASTDTDTDTDIAKWDMISNILGYTYFLSWTLSFYPQIITNWKHPSKALQGVSLDFVVWNIVGFSCYAIYTTSFRYSDVVRKEYAERFGGDDVDSDGDGDVSGNFTSSFIGILLSENSESHYNHHHHTEIASNPFSWIWGNNSTQNGTDSNTTNSNDDTANNTDAVAVPQVKGNDVAFAWHALILTIITFVQIVCCSRRGRKDTTFGDDNIDEGWIEVEGDEDDEIVTDRVRSDSFAVGEEDDFVGSPRGYEYPLEHDVDDHPQEPQIMSDTQNSSMIAAHGGNIHWMKRISFTTKFLILLLLTMCITGAIMVSCNVKIGFWGGGDQWQWIDYLYFLSFVKVGVSIVKYIPQVVLNYRRKSTSGWQIWNILLDFSGGTLSIVQLVGDSLAEAKAQGLTHGWTGIIGNPAKFGLGIVSIFFDIIFMFQHYVLYRHSSSPQLRNESGEAPSNDYETPLLHDQ